MTSAKIQRKNTFLNWGISFVVGLVLSAVPNATASYNVSTIAGNGNPGFSGDGNPATSAMISFPSGVFVSAPGDVYFADAQNQRIRKITAGTGVISTIAGNGTGGFSGDGGRATSAALNFNGASGHEGFVVADSSGNIYFTDSSNNRIRKFTEGGNISTIAGTGTAGFSGDGGAATSAMLNSPYGVCLDGSGNVYFSDTGNNRIRKITMSSSLSTLASGLNNPFGVCTDSAGNVYFSDTNNHCIKMINATTGSISTIAGTGTQGFSGDGGAATSARLNSPRGIFFRNTTPSTIYVADTGNNRIRMFSPGGNISTIAGGGTITGYGTGISALSAALNQPSGVCVNSVGTIYIADPGSNRIRQFTLGGNISTLASAGIILPQGVCVDSFNNVYIANTGANTVIKRDSSNNTLFTISTGLNQPKSVFVDGSNLYITSNDNIQRASASNGADLTPLVTGLSQPSGVCVDSSGRVCIADTQSNTIKRFVAGGSISTFAGTGTQGFSGDTGLATAAQLNRPTGVYTDSSNNIYFVDTQNQRVRKITASTGIISTIAGNGTGGFSGDGGAATSAALNFTGTRGSSGFIFVDSTNNVYISDTANNRIRKFTEGGNISTIVGTGTAGFSGDGGSATSAMLQSPYGVCVDGAGSIYLADTGNHRIRKLTAASTTQSFTVAPGGSQTLSGTYSTAYITGGGTAVLPASNSISAVEVNNGTLQVSGSAPITFNASGGSAIVEILAAISTGAFTFNTPGAVKIGTGIAAILDAPSGNGLMSKTGAGRLRAIANLSSSTTPVAVSEGILEVSGSGKLPNAITTVSNGGTLQLGEASGSVAAGAVANASVASGGIMSILAGATGAVTTATIASGGIVSVAAGVTAPSGMFTSATFRSGGILQVADGATLGQSFTSVP